MVRDRLRTIFRWLARLTGNPVGQYLLDNAVIAGQFMQGIGAAVDPEISGERAIFDRIAKSSDRAGRGEAPLCLFDVGANCGQFLNLALDCLRSRKVDAHCFEPGLRAFELLCKAAANRSGVFVNNCALGKTAGRLPLFYDAEASVHASLTRRDLTHQGIDMNQSEIVEVQTVDQYCLSRKIRRIDLLKIDVEGHELDVLEGAGEMFRRSAVEFVTFEFGNANVDARVFMKDYFAFFQACGMRIARITPTGYCHELIKYKESLEQFRVTNLICYKA
ncbi:MAG TPA: FkbM family methyltransferase [Bryobacteraceae bacterium]|jgi:FkbM family methyltransferase